MAIHDILQTEDHNESLIVMHAEGTFWHLYDRSCYAFATQVSQMHVHVRPYKVLGGRKVCWLGFPMKYTEKYLSALTLVEETDKQRTYKAPLPLDVEAYSTNPEGVTYYRIGCKPY